MAVLDKVSRIVVSTGSSVTTEFRMRTVAAGWTERTQTTERTTTTLVISRRRRRRSGRIDEISENTNKGNEKPLSVNSIDGVVIRNDSNDNLLEVGGEVLVNFFDEGCDVVSAVEEGAGSKRSENKRVTTSGSSSLEDETDLLLGDDTIIFVSERWDWKRIIISVVVRRMHDG